MGKHDVEEPLKRGVPQDMASIPAGMFLMGSNDFYPEERPVHRVRIDEFRIDKYPVTNAAFRTFVESTSYVTFAERPLNPADYPDADPALMVPGSLVFQKYLAWRVSLAESEKQGRDVARRQLPREWVWTV